MRRRFLDRALALLLVAVMVAGLLPVMPADAAGDGDDSGGHTTITDYSGSIEMATDGGTFVRFTLVRINTPDGDSVGVNAGPNGANLSGDAATDYNQGGSDLGLNPGIDKNEFSQPPSRGLYEVIGSVNIGTKQNSDGTVGVLKDHQNGDKLVWFDTNAMEYRLLCQENSDLATYVANSAYVDNTSLSAEGPNKTRYFEWADFCDTYCVDGVKDLLGIYDFVWDNAAHSVMDELLGSGIGGDVGGGTKQWSSSSPFVWGLCDYFEAAFPNANIGRFTHPVYNDGEMSSVFEFDGLSYRIIAEPGTVAIKKNKGIYYAVTGRDIAALGIGGADKLSLTVNGNSAAVSSSTWYNALCYDQGLGRVLNGMRDNQNQPHGYFGVPVPDSSGTGDCKVYSVQNATPGAWLAGKSGESANSLKADAGINAIFGTGGDYYAYGMMMWMPMVWYPTTPGLSITKNVTNKGDEYANIEWSFQLEINPGPEVGSPPEDGYRVLKGADVIATYTSVADLVAGETSQPIKLKSGETYKIENLPKGTTYRVEELADSIPPATDPSEAWKTKVTDSGAADTSEHEAMFTEGTIPDSGTASVTFKNTKPGGPAHLIIDYNLPGGTATYDEETGTITAADQVDCGTHSVEEDVPLKLELNGTPLSPGTVITLPASNGSIEATFEGLYKDAAGTVPANPDGSYDHYTLEHEDLTVLYVKWSLKVSPIPIPGGQLYTVFWDYNYDGGGVTSSLAGKYSYTGSACHGSYHFELPIYFSHPDVPLREGWMFAGWSLDPNADAGTQNPPDPGHSDTYYAIWKAKDTDYHANGGTFKVTNPDGTNAEGDLATVRAKVYHRGEYVPIVEYEPSRVGYTFTGWYLDKECQHPLEDYEEGVAPGLTYYAGWSAEKVKVTYYDVREGTSVVHTQEYNYNDLFDLFDPMNNTAGWNFDHWALTTPDGEDAAGKDGMNLVQDFPLVYHKYYGEGADPNPDLEDENRDPALLTDAGYWTLDIYAVWSENTTDYDLKVVWNDIQNNDGCRPIQLRIGLVDSYMNNEVIAEETVDCSETENVDTFDGLFADLPVEDNDASLQKRHYKLVFLGYTDCKGEKYTMKAPAVDGDEGEIDLQTISTGSDATLTQYAYGVNNYSPGDGYGGANTGYDEGNYHTIITFDHALIDTGDDIKFTIEWDDDGDNDGKRPGSVMLVLYADGVPVYERPWENHKFGKDSVSAGLCEVTNDGNTWTYIFPEYQRYHDGAAIEYTVAIKNRDDLNSTFNKDEYVVEYLNPVSEEAGSPDGCIIHRKVHMENVPVRIVWTDENNRDGQRPEYVTVALMANQWNDHTFRWEYEEIATQVIRANDGDARNTMTADTWYGTFGSQKVYNDGLRRVYHLVVLSDLNQFIPEGSFEYGWTEDLYGNQRLTDKDYEPGIQRRDPVAQVRIGQNTNTVSVTGNIYWDDTQNNDNIRPKNVVMQLYSHAPGGTPEPVPGAAYRVTVSGDPTADNWYYTFSGMPKYADGQSGVELVYSIKIEEADGEPLYGSFPVTDHGTDKDISRYDASYLYENPDGMGAEGDTLNTTDFDKSDRAYVRLHHTVETEEVPVKIIWDDEDNRDGQRPKYVTVALMANQWNRDLDTWEHEEIATQVVRSDAVNHMTASEWAATFGLQDVYHDGERRVYHLVVLSELNQFIPEGSFQYGWTEDDWGNQLDAENVEHPALRDPVAQARIGQNTNTVTVTGTIYWDDSQNNDDIRPKNVIMQLYSHAPGGKPEPVPGAAYRVNLTGDPVADDWHYTFSGMPKYVDGLSGVEL